MWTRFLIKDTILAIIFASLVYINTVLLNNSVFGWVILATFCLWSAKIIHDFLIKYFDLSGSLRIRLLAIFFVIAILGFFAGLGSWVYKISPLVLALVFFFVGAVVVCLKKIVGEKGEAVPEIEDEHKQVVEEVPSSKVGLFLYFVLIFFGFYFLSNSSTGENILTPWQTISGSYAYIFFAATTILGCLIFSKLKSSILLFLLVLHALLLHAYLPLSHSLFYGADGWRHLAIENRMLLEGVEKTLSFSATPVSFWQRFNFGGLAYAQFNSLAVLFKMLCQLDLIIFLRYFIPLIWSVVLPILLFEIARTFGWEKKRSLLLVFISTLPFALQVSGSFGLPSNLSFLFWLFILLLQFKIKQKGTLVSRLFVTIFGLLSIFGHSLYFILFCLNIILLWLFDTSPTTRFKQVKNIFAVIVSLLTIPSLELISHFSQFNPHLNWWGQIKLLISNLTGWYVATGLRSSDISTGNIIFNQPPLNSMITNLFTVNRFWICGFVLVFWAIFIFGWYKLLQKNKNSLNNFWLILTLGLFGGYIISRYFLVGENILSRRLDAVLATLIIFPVAYYLYDIIVGQKNIFYQRLVLFFVLLVCSAAITASYTLGPDTQVVSQSQYSAVDYVWKQLNSNSTPACVLSDTYTLLVMEGLSSQKIVGGGFPMNLYFVQPEKDSLWSLAKTEPQLAISQSKKILNTNSCYLIGEFNFPDPIASFGNIKVYRN